MKRFLGPLTAAGLLFSACGESVEFNAIDAEGLASIVDAGIIEESGLKGLITEEAFSAVDVSEFNTLAEDACADLSNGISSADYAAFEAGVLEGAEEMQEMIDTKALTMALVTTACPSYSEQLTDAMDG